MIQLRSEALDHPVHIRCVANDKLDNVLQWIVALRLRIEAAFTALFALEDGDLKDHTAAKLGGLELEAVKFANGAQCNPLKSQRFTG